MKKVLFIGGTGTISTACVEQAIEKGFDVTILNRGNSTRQLPSGVSVIKADINDESAARKALNGREFDVVADFVAYTADQAARDIRLFEGAAGQYIVISSASAYQKPLSYSIIRESTPLANPLWQYSRDKIALENCVMDAYRRTGFPVTIVRPSHTYGDTGLPVQLHGEKGSWQVIKRIMEQKPVVIAGDGLNWWTLTHNSDFARAFVGIMGNPHAYGEAFHITSDESLTWNQIHETIGNILGKNVNFVHVSADMLCRIRPDWTGGLLGDKCVSVHFDNSKIKSVVPEYLAVTRFDQGAARTLEYILSHEECRIEDKEFDSICDSIVKNAAGFSF